ncbi:MAG TPA: CPBP family intramembrane glutamic endopeptidase, partial [Caproiciproducens sp.]|nr:CPBP family intramembrane glutamic endopeptidase [Caproiciproducens sp.]
YLSAIGYTPVDSQSDFAGFTPELYYLMLNAIYMVALAAPPLIYFRVQRIPLSEALPFERAGFVKTAACVFFGAAVCMLANIPANFVDEVQDFFGFQTNLEMPLTNDLSVLILYGIMVAVIPPIVEELLFRGMVLHGLRRYGDGFAVVVSSILFGLYHGNFVQIVFAFFSGIAMALVVVKTGSLWASVLVHFINNAVAFAIELLRRFVGNQVASTADFIIMAALIVLGMLSLIFLIVKDRNFFRLEGRNLIIPLGARIRAAFANPGGVAMLIFALVSSVHVLTKT